MDCDFFLSFEVNLLGVKASDHGALESALHYLILARDIPFRSSVVVKGQDLPVRGQVLW